MTVAPRRPALPSGAQAILVTSANALFSGMPDLPVYAVGDATASAARALGRAEVESAGRDAEALAALVIARRKPADGPLLLLSGAGQGNSLARALRAAGFRVQRRVTYAAIAAPFLPPSAITMLRCGEGFALFFSPETARIFVRLFRRALPASALTRMEALAMSAPTAEALAPLPWASIRIASHPNQDALLALLP